MHSLYVNYLHRGQLIEQLTLSKYKDMEYTKQYINKITTLSDKIKKLELDVLHFKNTNIQLEESIREEKLNNQNLNKQISIEKKKKLSELKQIENKNNKLLIDNQKLSILLEKSNASNNKEKNIDSSVVLPQKIMPIEPRATNPIQITNMELKLASK